MLIEAADGVDRIRDCVVELAVQGRLVAQSNRDRPASELLAKARKMLGEAKNRRTVEGLSPEPKVLPIGWVWCQPQDLGVIAPRNESPDEAEVAFVPMPVMPTDYRQPVRPETRRWGDIKKGYTHIANGDVAVAKITPCFQNKKSCVMHGLPGGLGAGTTELLVLRPAAGIADPSYLLLFFKSPGFVSGGVARVTGTAGQQRVPVDYFAAAALPLPPLAEQKRIVAKVDELMRLLDDLEAKQAKKRETQARLRSAALGALTSAEGPGELARAWGRVQGNFGELFERAERVGDLRRTILEVAVSGKLVAGSDADEPATELLRRIAKARGSVGDAGPDDGLEAAPKLLPNRWTWSRVGDIATVSLGGTPPREDSRFWGGDVPWISSGEVANCRIGATREKLTTAGLAASNAKLYPPGTVLIAMIGQGKTRGQSALLDITSSTNQNVAALVFDGGNIHPPYVWIWALSEYARTRAEGRGGAQPALNGKIVRGLWFPLPPLAEQRRIVARIEHLMKLCDDLEAKLQRSEETAGKLVEAVVAEMVAG